MAQGAWGQISPGDLTQAHADLEGMSNCTQCHDIGSKVSNSKCLECHDEISALVSNNKGYHAHRTVKSKDCFDCHSEHHGRKFDMVRFETNNFNHDLTGYSLEGAHAKADCKECHMPENIANREIRQREDTFLGLDTACLSCHDDFHQGTLSNDCTQCHTMDAFRPASLFDHATTEFPLNGGHANVDCIECHKETTRNGQEFQEFSGIAFNDCVACHTDPHKKQLPGSCTQCHTDISFNTFIGKGNFRHSKTGFTLKGAHLSIDCFTCHKDTSQPLAVFQDQSPVEEANCVACHQDPHENKFGQNCAECHNEESFFALNNMDLFDHGLTDYPLEGKHTEVDCKSCHKERFSVPIDFSRCSNCHTDYHEGEFAENGISPDCVECHSLNKGFEYTLYTISDHQESAFPLEGAHIATPCFACHVSEEDQRWSFANMGASCVDCHDDFHEGYISASYYPKDDCTVCHSSEAWSSVAFNHSKTKWPLEGKHAEVACSACHFEFDEGGTLISQNFTNLDTACTSCHENIHGDQFAINGVTECTRCHVLDSWFPRKFNHNDTRFPLEGKHAEVSCEACHLVESQTGVKETIYQLNKLECADCHLQ